MASLEGRKNSREDCVLKSAARCGSGIVSEGTLASSIVQTEENSGIACTEFLHIVENSPLLLKPWRSVAISC